MTQQMPNPIELYEAAARNTRNIIAGIKPSQLKDSTPCAMWNVQDLIEHIVGGTDFFHSVLAGTQPSGAKASSDSVARYDEGVKKVLAAARTKGTMEKTVQSPVGPMSAAQFVMTAFMDTVVHGWDLAKATKQDTKIDPKHVEVLYSVFGPVADKMRDPKFFGPRVQVPDNASTQDRLLGALGRKP
jgi:uncharacterized protein (TIGR03086 family)